MSTVINTNVSSLVAQTSLQKTGRSMDTSLERLASGLRINSAKDDAAGLAIANRLSAQVGGLRVGVRNANDGISLAQTAEGALQESTNIILRIRDLAVQAVNDSNDDVDRANIQKEVGQLIEEVDRIATTTKFGGLSLLDSSFTSKTFQVGAFAGEEINLTIDGARKDDLGSYSVSSSGLVDEATQASTNSVAAGSIQISGEATASVSFATDATAKDIAKAVNDKSATTGVTATVETNLTLSGFSGVDSTDGQLSFSLQGSNASAQQITVDAMENGNDLTNVVNAINDFTTKTGISANFGNSKDTIVLTSSDGDDIKLTNFSQGNSNDITFTAKGAGSSTVTVASAGSNTSNDVTVGGTITFNSNSAFSVTDSGTSVLDSASSSSQSQLKDVDVSTQSGAKSAIAVLDASLQQIDDSRATLGAVQNRLVNTINNLSNVANNQEAARSRIIDADFAQETAKLTKNQILQQAGISILSQANSRPQAALSLLG